MKKEIKLLLLLFSFNLYSVYSNARDTFNQGTSNTNLIQYDYFNLADSIGNNIRKFDTLKTHLKISISYGLSVANNYLFLKNGHNAQNYFKPILQSGHLLKINLSKKNYFYSFGINYSHLGYKSNIYDTLNWIGLDWDMADFNSPFMSYQAPKAYYKNEYMFFNVGLGFGYLILNRKAFNIKPSFLFDFGSLLNYRHTIYGEGNQIVYKYDNNKSDGVLGPVYGNFLFHIQSAISLNCEFNLSKKISLSISPYFRLENKFRLYDYGAIVYLNYQLNKL